MRNKTFKVAEQAARDADKKRTPTTETPRSATDGCNAAVEMSQAEVPISATLEPIVPAPIRTESANTRP